MGLSGTMILVSYVAMIAIVIITWVLTYLPYRINWQFWMRAFLAAITVGALGVVGLIFKFISWLILLIF